MSNRQNLEELQNSFNSLPRHIKEWLSSEQVSYLVHEINNHFDFRNEKMMIIPNLILYLSVKELDPLNFLYELSQKLNIDFDQAKIIAKEIEEKILKPIKMKLYDIGIDISMIHYGKPEPKIIEKTVPPASPPIKPSTQPSTMPYAPIQKSFRDFIPRKPGSRNSAASPENNLTEFALPGKPGEPAPKNIPKKATVDLQTFEIQQKNSNLGRFDLPKEVEPPDNSVTPFMLHQEDGATATLPTNREKSTPKFSIKPELEIKVQDYYQTPPEPKKAPVPVKVETPHANSALPPAASETQTRPYEQKGTPNSTPRVVHYGGFRTPINNLGYAKDIPRAGENTVDLRKFSRPENSK